MNLRHFIGKRRSREQEFWDWFSAHSLRYLELDEDRLEEAFDELRKRLKRIHPDLTFEFSVLQEFGREFVISADGNRAAFPAVIRLVNAAPDLPNWKVVAFRPRESTEMTVSIEGVTLRPELLRFKIKPDGSRVGIHLYIRGYRNDKEDKPLAIASFLFLDHVLGEFDVETKVGFIERSPLPSDPVKEGLRPISELAPSVDQLHSELNPAGRN